MAVATALPVRWTIWEIALWLHREGLGMLDNLSA